MGKIKNIGAKLLKEIATATVKDPTEEVEHVRGKGPATPQGMGAAFAPPGSIKKKKNF